MRARPPGARERDPHPPTPRRTRRRHRGEAAERGAARSAHRRTPRRRTRCRSRGRAWSPGASPPAAGGAQACRAPPVPPRARAHLAGWRSIFGGAAPGNSPRGQRAPCDRALALYAHRIDHACRRPAARSTAQPGRAASSSAGESRTYTVAWTPAYKRSDGAAYLNRKVARHKARRRSIQMPKNKLRMHAPKLAHSQHTAEQAPDVQPHSHAATAIPMASPMQRWPPSYRPMNARCPHVAQNGGAHESDAENDAAAVLQPRPRLDAQMASRGRRRTPRPCDACRSKDTHHNVASHYMNATLGKADALSTRKP